MPENKQKLLAVLEYLENWDKLTRTAVKDVAAYGMGLVAYQADIEDLKEIRLNTLDANQDPVWVEVPRLHKAKPPEPSKELLPWIILSPSPDVEPGHRAHLTLPSSDGEQEAQELEFSDELKASLDNYVGTAWRPWSEVERVRRKHIALYEKLFQVQQAVETAGAETPLELVIGMGMAVWQRDGHKICHPIVTQQVEVYTEEGSVDIRIRPTSSDPRVETDPFLSLELPNLASFEHFARACLAASESTPSPFEPESFRQIVNEAVAKLDTSGESISLQAGGEFPASGDNLRVTDSWVLFARKRTTNFLLEDLARLKQEAEKAELDHTAKFLVEDPSGALPEFPTVHYRGLSSFGDDGAGERQELFFPKPFNDEQVEIVRRLENQMGVVVQGPPGTGKTHTIANVICHYMALGRSVLVTSKGETALAVLQSHIPEGIRKLTVSLLTNERAGKEQLKSAVEEISARVNHPDTAQLKSSIKAQQQTIDGLHKKIAQLDSELLEWARKNTESSPEQIGGLKPEALAREVVEKEKQLGWFPDSLDDSLKNTCPLTAPEMASFRAARKKVGKDLQYLFAQLPDPESLPSGDEIAAFHESLCEKENLLTQIRREDLPRLAPSEAGVLERAGRLQGEMVDHIDLATTYTDGWHTALRTRFRENIQVQQNEPTLVALNELRNEVSRLEQASGEFVATSVTLPDTWRSDQGVRRAIRRATEGKSPMGVKGVFPSATKKALSLISINGNRPRAVEDWRLVERYCRLLEAEDSVSHRWNKLAEALGVPPIDAGLGAGISILSDHGVVIEKIETLAINYDSTLAARVKDVFPDIRREVISHETHFLVCLEDSLRRQLRHAALASVEQQIDSLRIDVASSNGPFFSSVLQWLNESLGTQGKESSEIAKTWKMFVVEVARLHGLKPDFETIKTVVAKLHAAGAKKWSESLAITADEGDQSTSLISDNWPEAWLWSQKRGFLERIDGRAEILQLARARHDAELRLQTSYEQLIENKTWVELVEKLRLDRRISRGITAYVQAISSMTLTGKGKRDVKLRQAAREAMHHASGGVPCWIMPHWRISESLPAEFGKFDLVVIDEASQSDAWALPSILRGKKVLIVGDDKQVGPQQSFLKQVQVDHIQEGMSRLGISIHVRNALDPKGSVYSLGELLFAGQTIRLREHFRCAEAIIEFSNKLCYDNQIKCVRIPTADERLLPTLVDVHVRNGFRDALSATNKPEAEAIVSEVAQLVTEPSMQNRSIGVVSLLGHEQGKLIFDLLLERIGEEAFLRHKIRCGDARTFQGSEADIVFISAVDDPRSGGVMTVNRIENVRRINVAVSRAKDRLYFYHSFAADDLSALDLRVKLIEHFKSPVKGLRSEKGRDLCESEFEREMFDSLVQRNYRVLPQIRAGTYRIDFVVEGHQGRRLAIECDGDAYHGPEKWMDDYRRQRLLERAGWKFWRCWGSSFARDKKACLDELAETLSAHGIEPLGSADVNFTGLVEFRTVEQSLQAPSDGELFEERAEAVS